MNDPALSLLSGKKLSDDDLISGVNNDNQNKIYK